MMTQHTATNSFLEIDPIGASITRLMLNNIEIMWSGTRPDGGKGVTHPCIPNFNIADGLPNHGPSRKEAWKKLNVTTFSWSMSAIDPIYPAGLEATREFLLEDGKFSVTTRIVNTSDRELPINIAEHHYFQCDTNARQYVKVNGAIFDKGGLEANAKNLPIGGNELIIEIPGKPMIRMNVEGYSAFAQWSQPDAPFVCIEPIQVLPLEPAKFMSDAPKIKPQEEKVFQYLIENL